MDVEASIESPSIDLNKYHEDYEGIEIEGSEKIEEVVKENLNEPKVGMKFDSFDDMLQYYRKYGNEKGFPVKIRTSRKRDDGDMRWVTLACCREGKSRSTVLIHKKFENVPEKYIFRRWRKDVKRCHTKIKILYSNWAMNPENEHRDKLCNAFYEGVELVVESEEKTKMAMGWIERFINEFKNGACINETTQRTPSTVDQPSGSGTIIDLLVA
ncbi:hypothetical protein IFM89_013749 [Coptis chinensis]|uniref:Protein FAR1-RELATED SEQUENCE n=1 Tax=Coptis chinensis TaxID=261450 RepID=A0A835LVS7_9MAGN|nr:hypothetical protein IFM89_013749 [Coptis chinensis]